MKLELKHLAPYLPYGLKAEYFIDILKIKNLTANKNAKQVRVGLETSKYTYSVFIGSIKPILRPLPVIKHNRKQLAEWLYDQEPESFDYVDGAEKWIIASLSLEANDWLNMPYKVVNKLFEWHFDVFGLIPEGLAIDINKI